MTRRELLLLVGGAVTASRAVHAQQKAMPVIGFLNIGSPGPNAPFVAAFHQGLSETGYVAGHNVAIEYRWAEGHYDRLPGLAADLVGHKVDVIVTGGTPGIRAAKPATDDPDRIRRRQRPDRVGLSRQSRPAGWQLTGFSNISSQLTPKRLDLLSDLVPHAKVIGLLADLNNPGTDALIPVMQEAALVKGVQLPIFKASTESEIDAAFASLVQTQAGGARHLQIPTKSPADSEMMSPGDTR